MKVTWLAAVSVAAVTMFAGTEAKAPAQVVVGVGVAPVCPYGYYGYAPYGCAPYGYYGPDWFNGGVFIGAGPWFHGSRGFYGHVDNRYDPHFGYRGPYPDRGAVAFNHFQGNAAVNERGQVGNAGHGFENERNPEAHGAFGGGSHGGGGGESRGGGGGHPR